MAVGWSINEVDLTVADYMAMLSDELRGLVYNKSAHRTALLPLLENRTPGSVERKHQNISAVLIEFGLPYISGYKPLGNYQALLAERVAAFLEGAVDFIGMVAESVDRPATPVPISDLLQRVVDAPGPADWAYSKAADEGRRPRTPVRINFLEREARNASLGRAGEIFVVEFEKARLTSLGREQLADRIEHTSVIEGDGSGFDIRSFEKDGSDRLIEVKTTAGGPQTPFFVSRNELEVSRERFREYHLYRVFAFRKDPRLFKVAGALDETFRLDPSQFRARIA